MFVNYVDPNTKRMTSTGITELHNMERALGIKTVTNLTLVGCHFESFREIINLFERYSIMFVIIKSEDTILDQPLIPPAYYECY